MTTRTSCPSAARALGSEPHTSARPPALAKGATSALRKRILSGCTTGLLPFAEFFEQVQDLGAALLEDGEQGDDEHAQHDTGDVPQPRPALGGVADQGEQA